MRARQVMDVSSLPTEVFGSENITWWAAIGGEVIEGFVLVLAVFAYFYLAHGAPNWPPLHTPNPSLGPSTLNLVLMAVSILPAWWAARAAMKRDRVGVTLGLILHAIV